MPTPATEQSPKTKVIFRKWHNGEVIALFPELPHDVNGIYCVSYERIGQHGAADAQSCVSRTTPATPQESAELAQELKRIGYDLKPISRIPSNAYQARKSALALTTLNK